MIPNICLCVPRVHPDAKQTGGGCSFAVCANLSHKEIKHCVLTRRLVVTGAAGILLFLRPEVHLLLTLLVRCLLHFGSPLSYQCS